jgi:hypothetical protein
MLKQIVHGGKFRLGHLSIGAHRAVIVLSEDAAAVPHELDSQKLRPDGNRRAGAVRHTPVSSKPAIDDENKRTGDASSRDDQ